ncbi:MAG: phosphonate metabolism protein PhnP [Betaproteobacteria bacterium HGW-Betaproteobacteria-17]|nr:MAG: phosphonate metabolism protein PhnP [Betaproteobacteria bacterium HGW-Betaproteobacteria-17]
MRLSFLGTGSTSAPPLYGCACEICVEARSNPQTRRRPASALIEAGETRLLIDAGLMDLAKCFSAGDFPTILLTHFHPDHVQGLFHLRWGLGRQIPVYCPPDSEGCADLYKNPGLLEFKPVRIFDPFPLGPMTVTPMPLIHSKITLGYCIESGDSRIAYLTDTAWLPRNTEEFLRDWQPSALVIDCSLPPQITPPKNHNDVTLTLAVIAAVQPQRAWLTHIGHELDAWLKANGHALPPRVFVARDGEFIHDPLNILAE